ncbi:MAG: hypothetical protein ACFFDG_10365 [Promethearchaeota archaeon]
MVSSSFVGSFPNPPMIGFSPCIMRPPIICIILLPNFLSFKAFVTMSRYLSIIKKALSYPRKSGSARK